MYVKKRNSRDIIRIFREILRNLRKFSQVNAKLMQKNAQNAIIKTRNGNINSVSRAINENKCIPFQCVVFLCYNFYFYFCFPKYFSEEDCCLYFFSKTVIYLWPLLSYKNFIVKVDWYTIVFGLTSSIKMIAFSKLF